MSVEKFIVVCPVLRRFLRPSFAGLVAAVARGWPGPLRRGRFHCLGQRSIRLHFPNLSHDGIAAPFESRGRLTFSARGKTVDFFVHQSFSPFGQTPSRASRSATLTPMATAAISLLESASIIGYAHRY